ncbi:4945_t:CDS:2 [Gigaspora rosea]|nr:4945_t:CDS:2 [Gigaspora rosea]
MKLETKILLDEVYSTHKKITRSHNNLRQYVEWYTPRISLYCNL